MVLLGSAEGEMQGRVKLRFLRVAAMEEIHYSLLDIRKANSKDPSFRFDLPLHKRVGEVGTGGRKRQHWHVAETS